MLLERSGYSVTALGSDASVQDFLKVVGQLQPHLVLMCHSVPEASRVVLCSAIKGRFPTAPILMLYNGYDPTTAKVDGAVANMTDPQSFLDTVNLLLSPKAGNANLN
jgi:CheY-like chemotaxis protein